MSRFVVDASVVLAWLFPDEATPAYDRLLQTLAQEAVVEAPVLLRYEVSNVLVLAYAKRQRLSREECFTRLRDFDSLPIRYDVDSPTFATATTAQLAEDHGLTVYDAAYLELALRRGVSLATSDKRLREAAVRLSVSTL